MDAVSLSLANNYTDRTGTEVSARRFGAKIDGTSDDTAAINAAITAVNTAGGGEVFVPYGSGVSILGSALVLKSGVTLRLAPGVTLRRKTSGFSGNLIVNAAIGAGGRDTNIGLIGGVGSIIDGGDNSGASTIGLLHVRLAHIDGLVISGLKFTTVTGGKYAIRLADITKYRVRDLDFDTHSDGLHIDGPASVGWIEHISGASGDDLVAILTGEGTFPYAEPTTGSGDVTDLNIDGIFPVNTSLAALKIVGATGTVMRKITVRNISGSCGGSSPWGIAVIDDTAGPTDIDDLEIDGVHLTVPAGADLVRLGCSAAKRIKIGNLTEQTQGTVTANLINIAPRAGEAGASIQTLTLHNLEIGKGSGTSSPAQVSTVYVNGFIGDLIVSDSRFKMNGLGGNLIVCNSTTQVINRILLSDIIFDTGRVILQTATGQATPVAVEMVNVVAKTSSRIMNVNSTVEVDMTNCIIDSSVNEVFLLTAGALRIKGGAVKKIGASAWIARSASEVVSVNNTHIALDVAALTPVAGDEVNNTTASSTAALGPVIYDGSRWQSKQNAEFGFPRPVFLHNANNGLVANRGEWVRVKGSGTITKIGVHVGVQSGNVCAAVYANTGIGRAAKPGARKGTSGSVACPATGYQEISLGGSVWVSDGDWLYFGADNATTAISICSPILTSALFDGLCWWASTAFPAPDPAPALSSGASRVPFVIGVP